jgi:S1-C subfamily serine protease
MSDSNDWSFPRALQVKADQVSFDLPGALRSVVQVRSEIADEAFTAAALGTERIGNGIVIRIGTQTVVLTIAYLITEAHIIWLTTHDGRQIAGHSLACDQVTGLGLIVPLGELAPDPQLASLELGSSESLQVDSEVIVIGHGGAAHAMNSKLIAKREFAGYWEYLLDEALLVSPPHPQWGGTALVDQHGKLVGVGSLLIQESVSDDSFDANLFVPIDLLKPILHELLNNGKASRPTRPWLGLYTTEQDSQLVIAGVTEAGPAQQAELKRGDVITHVGPQAVRDLASFYRLLWAQGNAGSMIVLRIKRGQRSREIRMRSADRSDYLHKPRAH